MKSSIKFHFLLFQSRNNGPDVYYKVEVTSDEILLDKILPATVTHIILSSMRKKTWRDVLSTLVQLKIFNPTEPYELCQQTDNEIIGNIYNTFHNVKSRG